MNTRAAVFLSLFTSVGTLLCCALPALLVALGLGAVVAGIVSQVPALVWLSERKLWVFGIAAVMLTLAAYAQWKSKDLPCPLDSQKAAACDSARRWSRRILILSFAIYALGAAAAFLPAIFWN